MTISFLVLKAEFDSSEVSIFLRNFFKQPVVWPNVSLVLQTYRLIFLVETWFGCLDSVALLPQCHGT